MYICQGQCGKELPIEAFTVRNDGYRHKRCKKCDGLHDRARKKASRLKVNGKLDLGYMRSFARKIWQKYKAYERDGRIISMNIYFNPITNIFTTRKTNAECQHVATYKYAKKYHAQGHIVGLRDIVGDLITHIREEGIKYK